MGASLESHGVGVVSFPNEGFKDTKEATDFLNQMSTKGLAAFPKHHTSIKHSRGKVLAKKMTVTEETKRERFKGPIRLETIYSTLQEHE